MSIGDNIRRARKSLGMSQDDLAEAIGANRVTISKYESGRFLPSVPALERLAIALKTTTAKLSGSSCRMDDNEDYSFIQQDSNLQTLFDQAKRAKPEHIRAATAMLKSLENDETD